MGAKECKHVCKGCEISQTLKGPFGERVVELDGDWILNHYGGGDTFLGRMALQPRHHRMELSKLSTKEAKALGVNIQNIQHALCQYWKDNFSADRIERVYVVYFFESVYDIPKPKEEYHLHIHLIPRPQSFDHLLRERTAGGSGINAWKIYRLNECAHFPPKYQIKDKSEEEKERVQNLMDYLKRCLCKSSAS